MTNKEAIKFLKQIYPNGGHCWLDEQRIEAINMAIDALEIDKDPERYDLEQKAKEIATKWKAQGVPYNAIHKAVMEMVSYQWKAYMHLIWKLSYDYYKKGREETLQKLMKEALNGEIVLAKYDGKYSYGILDYQPFNIDERKLKPFDKVKIIIVKDV